MTLLEICDALKNIAITQPNINYTGSGDIYSLNSLPNINYGVFFITQSNHTVSEDTTNYNLTLYFIDRLFQDDSNTVAIQSTGIQVLTNIINKFNYSYSDIDIEYDLNMTTFLHKFSDKCAGVFCNVSIKSDNNIGIC